MKTRIKKIIFIFCLCMTTPMSFFYFVTKSESIFVFNAQLLALIPGKIGSYLRVAYYKQTLKKCSNDVFIGFGSYLTNPYVEIGNKVYVGAYNIIGIATLCDHVTIASHVSILSGKQQHGYKEIGKPIQEQKGQFLRVTINENCWIGNGAIIMADLGVQNVVAAGSVITKSTDDYEIWAGNPAILIKKIN